MSSNTLQRMDAIENNLVGNLHQFKTLFKKVKLLIDENLLGLEALEIINLLSFADKFTSLEYLVQNWALSKDDDEFESFQKLFGVPSEDVKEDILSDQIALQLLLTEHAAHYRPLEEEDVRFLPFYVDPRQLKTLFQKNDGGNSPCLPLRVIDTKRCELGKEIGSGVRKCIVKGQELAVKEFDDSNLARREATIMQYGIVPGAIYFWGVDDALNPTKIYMELALCTLNQCLYDEKYQGIFGTVDKRAVVMMDVAQILNSLVSSGMLHKDIKPANILIMPDHSVRIADLGLSKFIFLNDPESIKNEVGTDTYYSEAEGTPEYMCPFNLMEIEGKKRYSDKTDMFSFAVTLNEVLICCQPTSRQKLMKLYWESDGKWRSDKIDSRFRELINRCWHADLDKRPTFSEVVQEFRRILNIAAPQPKLDLIPDDPSMCTQEIRGELQRIAAPSGIYVTFNRSNILRTDIFVGIKDRKTYTLPKIGILEPIKWY